MKTRLLTALVLSWGLAACGPLRTKLGIDPSPLPLAPEARKPGYCPSPSGPATQLVGSNPEAHKSFQAFLRHLEETEPLHFHDKAVFWSLLQMNLRPDLASPTARLQLVWRKRDGKSQYRDFLAPEDVSGSFPFLWALHSYLGTHPRARPLTWYAQQLDAKFQGTLVAGKTLEERLRVIQSGLAANPRLRRHFFRGDELLRENERLPLLPFGKVIREWQKSQRALVQESAALYSYRKTPQLAVDCNYDFSLYDNSIFLIDREENQGHIFGITQGSEAFLAIASQATDGSQELFELPLIAGSSRVRSNAMCLIEGPQANIWLAANQSRDPGQHLYHLFRYGILKAESAEDVERLISRSRHMFLSDPLRLIIESRRSQSGQLQELLKLTVPIYHADAIGNVWGWANFSQRGGQFFIDDRNPGALFCAP